MDVPSMPIRLVVKAPNQQVDDQMIECALDWTILKLKDYLSRVYPSEPKVEEQKLIYSGQLLHNHLTLKDILRQYDTETVHTLHLVCVPPRDAYYPTPARTTLPQNNSQGNSSLASPISSTTTIPSESLLNDGLRYRATGQSSNSQQLPEQFVNTPMYNVGPDSLGMPTQMAWMQQMYSQYMNLYYQQYLEQVQPPAALIQPRDDNSPVLEANRPLPGAPPAVQVAEAQPPPGPAINAAVAPINVRGAALDEEEDDEAPGNRDWLDWAYSLCRAMALFGLIHYYSSFGRFAVVAFAAALIYIHQMGWLGLRARPRVNAGNRHVEVRRDAELPRPNQQPPTTPQDDNNVAEEPLDERALAEQMQQGIREIENLMNQDLDEPNRNRRVGATSLAYTAWTFVATFFSSLLPERADPALL